MRSASAAAVTALLLGLAGCQTPGVIRNLPEPVGSPRRATLVDTPISPPRPRPRPRRFVNTLLKGKTIVVDPGHGGRDPGAIGVGPVPEEVVNLGVGLQLIQLLEDRGAHVVATRETDRFITLDDRADVAEQTHADLFVSVHADACPRPDVTGATIYIARGSSRASQHAAGSIASALESAGISCRGVRKAGFRVLVGHSRPAVLVECGYLTNHGEALRLSTSAYQVRLAEAIADGITDHLGG